jgi:hypothetical protein
MSLSVPLSVSVSLSVSGVCVYVSLCLCVCVCVCVCVCASDAVIRSSTNCYTSTRSATAKWHWVSVLRAVQISALTNPLCVQFRCKMCRRYFCGAHKDKGHHGCPSLDSLALHYDGFYSPPSSPNSVRDVSWDGGSHASTPGSRRADELDGGSHAGTPSSRVSRYLPPHDQDAAYDDCISGERSGEE